MSQGVVVAIVEEESAAVIVCGVVLDVIFYKFTVSADVVDIESATIVSGLVLTDDVLTKGVVFAVIAIDPTAVGVGGVTGDNISGEVAIIGPRE